MRVHIVQKGDTLWKIAKQYGIGFDELKRMNAQLANPDYIVPGMEIFLPEHGGMTGKEAIKGGKHTVVPEMMEKEMEWKPTKELQKVEEQAEMETYQPPQLQPSYSFTPSIYQMSYMPIHQQPIFQQPIYQMPIYQQPAPQPQQPIYQQPAPQPQQPIHHEPAPKPEQPMYEESSFTESMGQQEAYQEMPYEQPMYYQPMYHYPMHHQSPCGCHKPMHHQPSCGCHHPMMHHQQMMHHQPSCGCHQTMMYDQSMHQQPMMYQQPMYDQSMHQQQMMYQQPMYDQSMHQQQMMMYQQQMYDQSMYQQPADVCESSRPMCMEKEEQVKGYYEDIKQIEHAAKSPCAPAQFPYSTQQHWQ